MPEYIKHDDSGYIIQKFYSVDPSVVEKETNIIEIPRDLFNSLTEYYLVKNGKVVQMTQAEKDAYNVLKTQQAADAENQRLSALDDSLTASLSVRLTKVETMIDNIGSLADAKTFLKRLVRFMAIYVRQS